MSEEGNVIIMKRATHYPVIKPLIRSLCMGLALLWIAPTAQAQVAPPLSAQEGQQDRLINLNFRDAPLDQILDFYSQLTGRTMIRSPGISATITLRGQTRLTETEALQAIESALAMHNVALVPMGERFLRVVQPTAVKQEGLTILSEIPEDPLPDTDQLFSLVISLQHLELGEIQPVLQQLIHGYGSIQPLERMNSFMVTDTGANINRILQVVGFMDTPIEVREELYVRRINFAEAGQIASRLNEFIQDRDERQERPQTRTTRTEEQPERRAPPGVIRARREAAEERSPAATIDAAAAELAERGVIRGRVQIVADERINTLFIISRPVNFTFFDRIIDVLDQPVEPEIIVRVKHLEYALAEDIASILNEFIGAAASDESARALRAGAVGEDAPGARAEALRDFAAGLARERAREREDTSDASQFGRLSANTQILSDQRSNSLLLMGRRSDIAALEEIIAQLDIMLGQVLIEAVIVEINLGQRQESGIDWLQRTMTAYSDQQAGPAGGLTVSEPTMAFGGGSRPQGGDLSSARDSLLSGTPPVASGGLTYYLTFFDLNIDAILRLAATSRDARILSTPVILTTDNTEAKIIVGESRPIVTSTSASSVGDRTVSSYQYRDIGIDLTVTPRINPRRYVVMEISQSADNVGGSVTIDGNEVPIITRREMQANIAVRSRSTIVLGGLVSTDQSMTTTKVPLLGDIPLLGRLFRSETSEESRTELLVLITPYVLMTPDEARYESARLHDYSHSSRTQWPLGWSDSEFAVDETQPSDRFLRRRGSEDSRPTRERPASQDDFNTRPTVVPEDPSVPLEEGTYDRDSVAHILEELRQQRSVIQDEPAGVIEWEETEIPVMPPTDEAPEVEQPEELSPIPDEASATEESDPSEAGESRRWWSRRSEAEVSEEVDDPESPAAAPAPARPHMDLSAPVPR